MLAKEVLARTIWGEARGEGAVGMHAVANVILNRVAQPSWWGDTVESVCMKPFQFSAWNKSDLNRVKLEQVSEEDPQFRAALQIAHAAIAGELPDLTNGATHYHDKRMEIPPKWARGHEPLTTIGHHVFFKGVD
jgi:spore germination cell wall hydrolase CwlJ-like protein